VSLSEHFAADAAREAVDRLSDERDAALAEVGRVTAALTRVTAERIRVAVRYRSASAGCDTARAEWARVIRFMDAAWPVVPEQDYVVSEVPCARC